MNKKNIEDRIKSKSVIRIQRYWRLYQAIKYFKKFNDYKLDKKSETLQFDDFTKIMLNKELTDITAYLIYYIQYTIKVNLKINNRVLLSSYLFANYSNEILGKNNRDPLSDRIHFFSKQLTKSLVLSEAMSLKDQINILGNNMLNYSVTFSVWKMRDKSEMIQNMIISYYHREIHIHKIKSGELSTDGQKTPIKELEKQQKEILESIKLMDPNFDIKYFEKNYKMICETMEKDYQQLQINLRDTMKIAYFDYVRDGMKKGDYQPVLALIAEIRQRLLNVMANEQSKNEFIENVDIEHLKDKIINNELENKDLIVSIIHIVQVIKTLQAPVDDESHSEWKNTIAEQLTKQNEEDFYEILPEILIQAHEKIDKIYNDILKLAKDQ
jgi:hypothetical protein